MADCTDLNKRLAELNQQLKDIDELEARLKAAGDLTKAVPGSKVTKHKTYKGDDVTINEDEWIARGELDAIEMGDPVIERLVDHGLATGRKTAGRSGQMINFSAMKAEEEDFLKLLAVMGRTRANTPAGMKLKRVFSQSAAMKAVMKMATENNADPKQLAATLSGKFKNIDTLPENAYAVAKARWESTTHFADKLEQIADAIDQGTLDDGLRIELGNATKWAHFYEQLDSEVFRKLGQALQSRQKPVDSDAFDIFEYAEKIPELTFDDVKGDSLLKQVIEHVDNGDAMKLRRLAKAKRVVEITRGDLADSAYHTEFEILNTYRKAGLFSSASSWGVRNMSSGFVAAHLTLEDVVGGTLRVGTGNPLASAFGKSADALGEWHAATYAGSKLAQGFGMAWSNAWDSLTTGNSRMAVNALRDIDPQKLAEGKKFVETTLTTSLQRLLDPTPDKLLKDKRARALAFFNVLNGAVHNLIGKTVEYTTGSDAGYLASFRLLNAGDEFIRTMTWTWSTEHEQYLRAIEEFRGQIDEATGKPYTIAKVEEIVEQRMEKAMFSGIMTDDDLAKFRKERNATMGIPVGDEVDNDELRLQIFNNLNGVPNTADDIAALGVKRMEDVTFTGKIPEKLRGLQMLRNDNPLVAFVLPVFRSTVHGLGYMYNRNFIKAALIDMPATWVSKTATQAEKIDATSRGVVSLMLMAAFHNLWQRGIFTDGGPNVMDRNARADWERRNTMYSIDYGLGMVNIGRGSMKSIDFFDLMGMQMDFFRAIEEGRVSPNKAEAVGKGLITLSANVLKSKSGLKQMADVMNAVFSPDRYDRFNLLQRNMGTVMPLTGIAGNFERMNVAPNVRPDKRKLVPPQDAAAIGETPMGIMAKNMGFLLGDTFLGNYPGYNEATARPYKTDWLGGGIDKPAGMMIDATIPFTPLMMSQNPALRHLEEHGLGAKPRPFGKISGGRLDKVLFGGARAQEAAEEDFVMTNDEEQIYRTAYYTNVGGNVGPEAFGLDPNIAKYVNGKTAKEAILALRDDEVMQAFLNNPEASPSRKFNPTKALTDRANQGAIERAIYQPYHDVIKYYDELALLTMFQESDTFERRYTARLDKRAADFARKAESVTNLGVSRQ